jgi:hypothetical protein
VQRPIARLCRLSLERIVVARHSASPEMGAAAGLVSDITRHRSCPKPVAELSSCRRAPPLPSIKQFRLARFLRKTMREARKSAECANEVTLLDCALAHLEYSWSTTSDHIGTSVQSDIALSN